MQHFHRILETDRMAPIEKMPGDIGLCKMLIGSDSANLLAFRERCQLGENLREPLRKTAASQKGRHDAFCPGERPIVVVPARGANGNLCRDFEDASQCRRRP